MSECNKHSPFWSPVNAAFLCEHCGHFVNMNTVADHIATQAAAIEELEAECDRYREALEAIYGDYDVTEIDRQPPSIRDAWELMAGGGDAKTQ